MKSLGFLTAPEGPGCSMMLLAFEGVQWCAQWTRVQPGVARVRAVSSPLSPH